MLQIELQATQYDEIDPVIADWYLVESDSNSAEIQMDLKKLDEKGVKIQYYDLVQITFNDAAGILQSEKGKRINFG